jgi:hypothetical protein
MDVLPRITKPICNCIQLGTGEEVIRARAIVRLDLRRGPVSWHWGSQDKAQTTCSLDAIFQNPLRPAH